MRVRAHSVLVQVWLALLCALSAGFSGDLVARHPGHGHSTARHSRGTGHRSNRSVGRDGYGDHSAEVELLEHIAALTIATGDHPVPAIPPSVIHVLPQFVQFAWASPFPTLTPRATDLLALPARGPPACS